MQLAYRAVPARLAGDKAIAAGNTMVGLTKPGFALRILPLMREISRTPYRPLEKGARGAVAEAVSEIMRTAVTRKHTPPWCRA